MSVSWLAQEVGSGRIRWVLADQGGALAGGPGLPGDARAGSRSAIAAVIKVCQAVTLSTSTASTEATTSPSAGRQAASSTGASGASTLYDCHGRSQALRRVSG